MNDFQYATAEAKVCGVYAETMDYDKAVQYALRKMLSNIQAHIEHGHLADVTISISVKDCGEAVTYTEPNYYVNGERV